VDGVGVTTNDIELTASATVGTSGDVIVVNIEIVEVFIDSSFIHA
jgi:hypothetical protein